MKFGKTLKRLKHADWSDKYLEFTILKRTLKKYATEQKSIRDLDGADRTKIEKKWQEWYAELRANTTKVDTHYLNLCNDLEKHLDDTTLFIAAMKLAEKKEANAYAEYELSRMLTKANKIQRFADMNKTAFRKLLKKHDKMTNLNTQTWVQEIFDTPFGTQSELNIVRTKITVTADRIGLTELEECASLRLNEDYFDQRTGPLNFFLGVSLMAVFDILVLCGMRAWNPEFQLTRFMNSFPVFRLAFILIYLGWCIGAVLRVLCKNGIHYVYLLGLDPKNRIDPAFFFKLAAVQTCIWILTFGVYLVLFKFTMLGHQKANFFSGAFSVKVCPFWYPLVVLLVIVSPSLLPSDTFRIRYRKSLLRVFGSVFVAPLIRVTFPMILAGDILTSLVKPLKDLQFTACFYIHPESLSVKQNPCNSNNSLTPIILMLPFLFRFLQCMSRVYHSDVWYRSMDMINGCKYLSGILVTYVTSTDTKLFYIWSVSIFATVFMTTWDLTMDWSLFSGRQMLFHRRTYVVAAILNCFLRCAWVLTIIPAPRLLWCDRSKSSDTDLLPAINCPDVLAEQLLIFIACALEVARRSLWFVFRLENEHVKTLSILRTQGIHTNMYSPPKLSP